MISLYSPTIFNSQWTLRFLTYPDFKCRTGELGFFKISQHNYIEFLQQNLMAQTGFKPGSFQLPSVHASAVPCIETRAFLIKQIHVILDQR